MQTFLKYLAMILIGGVVVGISLMIPHPFSFWGAPQLQSPMNESIGLLQGSVVICVVFCGSLQAWIIFCTVVCAIVCSPLLWLIDKFFYRFFWRYPIAGLVAGWFFAFAYQNGKVLISLQFFSFMVAGFISGLLLKFVTGRMNVYFSQKSADKP